MLVLEEPPMPLSVRTPPREHSLPPDETRLARSRAKDDIVDDSVDVPAAVVCAACGDASCAGCERELSRSGIVAMVAWERPSAPPVARLWATARATTLSGETFFDVLPDGPLAPALRFAIVAELVASFGLVVFSLPVIALFAPAWAHHVVLDSAAREIALRVVLVGAPALALMLVAAHAAHGLALDFGARRMGAAGARGRALRFGLYAAGWDLVLGPVGAIVLGTKEGLGAVAALPSLALGLPGRCTRAFLRGYGLAGIRAEKANAVATATAVIVTIAGAVAVLVVAGYVLMQIE